MLMSIAPKVLTGLDVIRLMKEGRNRDLIPANIYSQLSALLLLPLINLETLLYCNFQFLINLASFSTRSASPRRMT